MKLAKIVDILDAAVLTGDDHLGKEIPKGGASDLMSDILAALSQGSLLLTGLTTIQAIRTALVAEVGAVVFVRNKKPTREVVDMAREAELPLLSTSFSMFVSVGRLYVQGLTGLDGAR